MAEEQWLEEALTIVKKMPKEAKEIRERALEDLVFFATWLIPVICTGKFIVRFSDGWKNIRCLVEMNSQVIN